jgi:hypothetical protein
MGNPLWLPAQSRFACQEHSLIHLISEENYVKYN